MTETHATDPYVSPYTGRVIDEWLEDDIELHDVDGDEIGKVVEVNPDFVVTYANSGFLGLGEPRIYYIPRDQIAREDEDDWYIGLDKDEIESMSWRVLPADSEWAEDWRAGEPAWRTERPRGTRIRRYEDL